MSKQASPHQRRTRSSAKSETTLKTPSRRGNLSVKREALSTPRSSARRSVKLTQRKFFTVTEDLKMLDHFLNYKDTQSSNQMAQKLLKAIDHSEESIRDRIKRVLSKLRQVDYKLLRDEAKVIDRLTRSILIITRTLLKRMPEVVGR
jgi:uncharacterized protein YPO0396